MAGKEGEFGRLLTKLGYIFIRSPGSGARTQREQPDFIFAHEDEPGELYAVEHKACVATTTANRVYVKEREIEELRYFAHYFGARAKVVARFSGDKTHYMVEPDEMRRTDSGTYVLEESDLSERVKAASFSPPE